MATHAVAMKRRAAERERQRLLRIHSAIERHGKTLQKLARHWQRTERGRPREVMGMLAEVGRLFAKYARAEKKVLIQRRV